METVRLRITELQSHPLQQVYGDLTAMEFGLLVEDLEELGQRQPIEVTRDGIIIDGHQRVRALQELGHTEVEAIVCEDLTDDQRDEMFLYANLVRRQLDPIAKARVITEIARREAAREGVAGDFSRRAEFRERLAERLGGGISGRTVGRYMQLLRLPRRLQDAVSDGRLPMTLAVKVERLGRDDQLAIAKQIGTEGSAKAVVRQYLEAESSNEPDEEVAADDDSPESWYQYLVAALGWYLPVFEADPSALVGWVGDREDVVDTLSGIGEFFTRMSELERQSAETADSVAAT